MSQGQLQKEYDFAKVEKEISESWEREEIFKFENCPGTEVFSVDTPPPYISAASLHVGHAMSYSQAEFVVRYQRMRGRKIFYPMGFDDNGLPTERYVEKLHNVSTRSMDRRDFIALCLEETRRIGRHYEQFWRKLGLSVDWTKFYSTIADDARKVAQWSFIDLYEKGHMYRSDAPVLWCPCCGTALAQADVDPLERQTFLNDIAFEGADGSRMVISTTRPELLPACVGLFCHPSDERYAHLVGKTAKVPLFGHDVPVMTDETVEKDFGTGLMMVCTFGDSEDVDKWKRLNLPLRVAIAPDGTLTDIGGEFAGMTVEKARKAILQALDESGQLLGKKQIRQVVGVHERCSTPHEYLTLPQWYIAVVKSKERFLELGEQLEWHPAWMKARYRDWVNGLKWDWNISRQRFYGVPFPVWYCKDHNHVILPKVDALPVDPMLDAPPVDRCPECGCTEFVPESDVMDTWMTSSSTPLINARWADPEPREGIYPMTVRVQAFEIIRTWLFYTVVKGEYHTGRLPWHKVMISGWGLNEQGKKISKRDLDKYDEGGFNRYDPDSVIGKYGADALRYWAASASLGADHRYHEKEVRNGRRLVLKLWNAALLIQAILELDGDVAEVIPVDQRMPSDRWILAQVHEALASATASFEEFDYAHALASLEGMFWRDFCDNYLEFVKERCYEAERFTREERLAARATLLEAFRMIIGGFAPFVPFITEELYRALYQPAEGTKSIHLTAWPEPKGPAPDGEDGAFLVEVVRELRRMRSDLKIGAGTQIDGVVIDVTDPAVEAKLGRIWRDLESAARSRSVARGKVEDAAATQIPGLAVQLVHTRQEGDAGAG
ncbi:MAG: valine--tRNA ligase [Pseudomonadota bacterium]